MYRERGEAGELVKEADAGATRMGGGGRGGGGLPALVYMIVFVDSRVRILKGKLFSFF
jgi:hypothetical protein